MKFRADEAETFLHIFSANEKLIAASEGCLSLELLRDVQDETVFFTISKWRSEEDLENYRESALFNSVWTKTKTLFSEKAEAWSLR